MQKSNPLLFWPITPCHSVFLRKVSFVGKIQMTVRPIVSTNGNLEEHRHDSNKKGVLVIHSHAKSYSELADVIT